MRMVRRRRRAITGFLAASALAFSGAVALALPAAADEGEGVDDQVVSEDADNGIEGQDGSGDAPEGDVDDEGAPEGIDEGDSAGELEKIASTDGLALMRGEPSPLSVGGAPILIVKVETADGVAVEGALVQTCAVQEPCFGEEITGIDGIATFKNMLFGTYDVKVSVGDPWDVVGSSRVEVHEQPTYATIVIGGESGTQNPDPETATLIVTVVDKAGNPVPDAVIRLCDVYVDCFDHGITDSDGVATKTGLAFEGFGILVYVGGNMEEPDAYLLVELQEPITRVTLEVDVSVSPPVDEGKAPPPKAADTLPAAGEGELAVSGADMGLVGLAAALVMTGLAAVALSARRQHQLLSPAHR